MRNLYETQLQIAEHFPSSSDTFHYVCSILRSLYQTSAVVALEVIRELTPDGMDNDELGAFAKRFGQPTDGLPIEILDVATPIIRGYVAPTYHPGWFEADPSTNTNLVDEASAWVTFRNKKPGHGVLSKADIDEWTPRLVSLVRRSLVCFGASLPQIVSGEARRVAIDGTSEISLSTPLVRDGLPVVISNVQARKGIWKLSGQTLNWDKSDSFTIDLREGSVFEELETNSNERFRLVELDYKGTKRSLFSNVPVRQTSVFVGRKTELGKLADWFNYVEDNRICLIYGDGGVGKTTMALEFLNRIFEGHEDLSAEPPTVICYYSAKMTRWTDQGVIHLRGIADAMEECVREILFVLSPVVEKSYYKLQGEALVDRVAGEFAQQGFKRDDILLVLDNTETLVKSSSEVEAFAFFVKQIGRRLGRVLITSRRRELVAFEPIPMDPLSDADCISLMRRLAAEYDATQIKQAGDPTLRTAATKLAKKPLLIDTLVKYLARSRSVGIDKAIDLVVRKNDDELLEFLYEDAWNRFSVSQQNVCLVLISAAVPLDSSCVADACALVGIHPSEFTKGLDEAYFTNTTDHGERYDLAIVDMARRFFENRLRKLGEAERQNITNIASKVDSQATDRERIETEYRTDRVAEAFRSQYAKAAKIAATQGDLKSAEENYKLALEDDPMNAALRDRFAWFLLHRSQRPENAREVANDAVNLDPNNQDAWFTLALCWYRLDNLTKGDEAIEKALKNGKSAAICLLRMGIARYYASKNTATTKDAIALLDDSDRLLQSAIIQSNKPNSGFIAKNRDEVTKYQNLILALRRNLKSRPE
ncbi:TPA: tetratricopeptide repeat protein [Burkholderia vietnamiensis]|nr:tetratricopeptide repeat protein [Burkholderia vietnamiensis]